MSKRFILGFLTGCTALVLAASCSQDDRSEDGLWGAGDDKTGDGNDGADDGGGDDGDGGGDDGDGGGDDDGGDDDGGDDGDDGGDDGGGIRLDVSPGGGGDGGDGQGGCEKVDFLFVVDNSGSMQYFQQQLANSFPGFISTIREQVAGHDYHVMVVDSDAAGTWFCEAEDRQGDPACGDCPTTCAQAAARAECQGYTCGTAAGLDPADGIFGCGVVGPYGGLASNPNIDETFECAATVGISGHWWERPVSAAVEALSPALNEPGGCNEGFLRDDAILVVTIVSDDTQYEGDVDDVVPGVNGTPQEWYDAIVAAKGGNVDAIVMLGIFRGSNGNPISPPVKFHDFVGLFGPQGRLETTDAFDYSPFFTAAVGLIDLTCDDFTPPG